MNAHDAKRFSELFAPDATVSEYGLGEVKGREAIVGGLRKAFDAFPDFKIGVRKIFVKNDVVVQEWVMTGTNKGEFNGARPTNKTIGVRGAEVLTFTPEGLIKQAHRYFDTSTVSSQLGLMKAPARPVAALPSAEPEWHIAKGTPEEDKLVEVGKAINGAFEKKSEPEFLGALSENVSWSNLTRPKDISGKASAKQFFGMFTKAFPDAKFSSDALFGVDDVVVSESSMTATHAGPLGPLKPTKKPVTMHGLDIMVVKDGKVASGSSYSNSLELLGQEGRRHMMNAPELLRAYLSKIQDPAAVAALFAEDGVLELPQMNVRAQGRPEIEKFIAGLLKIVPDFRFKDIHIFIETPDQAFGEYSVEAVVLTTGKLYKQTYAGRLVAEKGKIKLIREALDTLAGQRAFSKD